MIQTVHCVDELRGGVASVLFSYADACKGIAFNYVSVAPVNDKTRRRVEERGGKVLADGIASDGELATAIAAARKLTGADIFHVHRNWHNLRPAMHAKKAGFATVISHAHNVFPSTSRIKDAYHALFQLAVRRYADECWGCSPQALTFLYGKRPKNSLVLPNPVAFDRFRRSDEAREAKRRELGVADAFVLVHAGLPIPQKNHEFLLGVFAGVRAAMPNARLVLVGPDREKDAHLVRLARDLGVADGVTFCGYVDDVASYYAAGDLFVFPSLHEGLPLALFEAQASGLGFIASDAVTRISDLFGRGTFLPVNQGVEPWIEAICAGGFRRELPPSQDVEACPFNINLAAPRLEETYRALAAGASHREVELLWNGTA